MDVGNSASLSGMEVPISGSDSVRWIEVSVPSSLSSPDFDPRTEVQSAFLESFAPPTEDYASCSAIGHTSLYFVWRIHKSSPCSIELLQLSADKEFPEAGLRLVFPEPLSPFGYVFSNEDSSSPGTCCSLYVLTVTGVFYLLNISKLASYAPFSVFPQNKLTCFDARSFSDDGRITSISALPDCIVVGKSDGSLLCFWLGMLHTADPGFFRELRDESGIGRLWSLVSRRRTVTAVEDLVLITVNGTRLAFVLHGDGMLRVWNLFNYSRIFSRSVCDSISEGDTFFRLWVREPNNSMDIFIVALLYKNTMDNEHRIDVYGMQHGVTDRTMSLEPIAKGVPAEEGEVLDVKLNFDKIWILKENILFSRKLFSTNGPKKTCAYTLQEEFVSDQLFQNPDSLDDLLMVVHSLFSSQKEQIVPLVSSILLGRLFQPGVFHSIALRATLGDYNKRWTDTEFRSLGVGGLKNEILLLVENERAVVSPRSAICWWRNFLVCYLCHWSKNNKSCCLLAEPLNGGVGLVRKSSLSAFRRSEDIEFLVGSFDESDDRESFNWHLSDDELEILVGIRGCITKISKKIGKVAYAIYYEAFIYKKLGISFEDIVSRLMKILECGYTKSFNQSNSLDMGTDIAWGNEIAESRSLREFSIDMLFSFQSLVCKAGSWERLLAVIESYLQFLVPQKAMQDMATDTLLGINNLVTVQATSQVANMMFESAFDILLLTGYIMNIAGQISMSPNDMRKLRLEIVPMVQETISEWLIVLFLSTMPVESTSIEDFSTQLSTLQIDGKMKRRTWNKKAGLCDFSLALMLLSSQNSTKDEDGFSLGCLPSPEEVFCFVRCFISWIFFGKVGEESSSFPRRTTELALILLHNGQCNAVEHLLTIVETNIQSEKTSTSIQDFDPDWCLLHLLYGCCLLDQLQHESHLLHREEKIQEAIRRFFRASSGIGASDAFQKLGAEVGLPSISFNFTTSAAWKIKYYEWAMQTFERYNVSEGAYQFALAALEQADETLALEHESGERGLFNESATIIRGRLWANVFKFTLDLNLLTDAYCAIISNPDEEIKNICLRRLLIVLYERGGLKALCNGQLPLIGLNEKVERELTWKAERSDVSTKPSPYKLLYAFEMKQQNWQKAASYMYHYSARLRTETTSKDIQQLSLLLQERLGGLSAAINALHLVHPAYAWINPYSLDVHPWDEHYPNKKARVAQKGQHSLDHNTKRPPSYVNVEKLEREFVLTSAEYMLCLKGVRWAYSGLEKAPSDLVVLLVQANLYDMAFTIILTFWGGSALKRELEKVFADMAMKCCPSKMDSSRFGEYLRSKQLLLESADEDLNIHDSSDFGYAAQNSNTAGEWEILQHYLGSYRGIHARLPIVVAEALLRTDPEIELPLWLIQMFKEAQKEKTFGMAGQESSPASLFQLYVNYGRYTEATNLLLQYMKLFATAKPADVLRRKKLTAVWFPYTAMEQLWCQLEKSIIRGHNVDQCNKLKSLLHEALSNHLKMLKIDSEDAVASGAS